MPDQAIPIQQLRPSRPRGASYRCDYLTDCITVLSDGRVTCGFDDPFGLRNYGNIRELSVRQILENEAIEALRRRLDSGVRCADCHLYTRVQEGDPPPVPPPWPRRLIIETTIRCQLRCRNTSCDLNNDRSFKVREESFLSVDLFRKLMDEIGAHLQVMYFFNYGEPFLHPRAVEMLEYARKVNPRLIIATSTNGLMFARGDLATRIVAGGLVNSINFTIAGSDDATYQIYHKAGSFEQAFEGMQRVIAEKRRQGRSMPLVKWRYLLFTWNDTDEEVRRVRKMAADAGVDELRLMLCSAPLEGRSWRRVPGTQGFADIEDIAEYEQHYQPDPFGDRVLYPPESDPILGTFCWTSRRARLELPPAGAHASLLLARRGESAESGAAVRLVLPWGEQCAEVGIHGWAPNRIAIPAAARGRPLTVEVHVDEPYIPMRHRTSHDTRELGVMVSLAFAEPGGRCEGGQWPVARNVPADRWVASAAVRVHADAGAASVAVLNGEYSVDGASFISAPALVPGGSSVRVRHRSALPGMGRTTSLLVGAEIRDFTSITAVDAIPPAQSEERDGIGADLPALAAIDPEALVTQMYRDLLGRDPDSQGLAWWTGEITQGNRDCTGMAEFLLRSPEFAARTAPAVRVYLACTQCIPDREPLRACIARYWSGEPLEATAALLMQGGEFALRYGGLPDTLFKERVLADIAWPPRVGIECASTSRPDMLIQLTALPQSVARLDHRVHVAMVYATLLQRRPDDSGWQFWIDQCESGGLAKLLDAALGSPEYLRRFIGRTSPPAGAGSGNRTHMVSPPRDFESRASTNSAIPALE